MPSQMPAMSAVVINRTEIEQKWLPKPVHPAFSILTAPRTPTVVQPSPHALFQFGNLLRPNPVIKARRPTTMATTPAILTMRLNASSASKL